MWPFRRREPTKAELQGHRVVKIGEYKFTIRRLSPMLDFEPERMPTIFSSFTSRREKKPTKNEKILQLEQKRMLQDMVAVLEAGVVSPKLVPVGKGKAYRGEDGVTAEDLLRWDDIGAALYSEIINWSLVMYRGLKGVIEMRRNKALMIDAVAKRYGQRPSDIVLEEGSDAEKQMLDAFIAGQAWEHENKAREKAK